MLNWWQPWFWWHSLWLITLRWYNTGPWFLSWVGQGFLRVPPAFASTCLRLRFYCFMKILLSNEYGYNVDDDWVIRRNLACWWTCCPGSAANFRSCECHSWDQILNYKSQWCLKKCLSKENNVQYYFCSIHHYQDLPATSRHGIITRSELVVWISLADFFCQHCHWQKKYIGPEKGAV